MRAQSVLEVVVAVLLGVAAVATSFGAYQATVWGRQAGDLAAVSEQLRTRNLTELLSSQLTFRADSRSVVTAFSLESVRVVHPELGPDLDAQQQQLLATVSPELAAAWTPWAAAGYPADGIPLLDPDYAVALYADAQSLQYASSVADRMVDRLAARTEAVTGASVLFAVALLLLGLAGVSLRWRRGAVLAGAGGVVLVVGIVVTAVAAGS